MSNVTLARFGSGVKVFCIVHCLIGYMYPVLYGAGIIMMPLSWMSYFDNLTVHLVFTAVTVLLVLIQIGKCRNHLCNSSLALLVGGVVLISWSLALEFQGSCAGACGHNNMAHMGFMIGNLTLLGYQMVVKQERVVARIHRDHDGGEVHA